MNNRYDKSPAGRAELTARALGLPRGARNLLFIIDHSRTGAQWVEMVQGATPQDLQRLVDDGLLTPYVSRASSGRSSRPAPLDLALPVEPVSELSTTTMLPIDGEWFTLVSQIGYGPLSTFITENARPRLGLIKGLKFVLEVEKCADVAALQAVTLRFIAQVKATQGDAALAAIRKTLSGFVEPETLADVELA